MKSNSDVKPSVFQNLGNGAWYYNYNIVEVERPDEEGKLVKSFDYDTVQVWGLPTAKEVKKQVIGEHWDLTEEINLQNGFQRFSQGLSKDKTLKEDYVNYLEKVDSIKEMIDSDFEEYKEQLIQ